MEKGLLITYLLTYGGALASLFNPYIGLLIYICFAIIKPEFMWHWSVPAGNYSRIVAIALLAGWALGGCGKWHLGRAKGTITALLVFWGWAALSSLQAPDTDRSHAFLEAMAKIVLPCVVGITLLDSVPKLKMLAWTIVLSQGYVAFELNMAYLGGFNRLQTDGFGGMDNNCVAIAMVTGVGLSFFLGLNATSYWQKGVALSMTFFMAHAILFSFSRGGMVALILTGVMSLFLIKMQPKHYLMLILGAVLMARLAGPEVQTRFMTIFASGEARDASAGSRLELWSNCLDAMAQRPLFGLGPAHWPLVAASYGWPPGKEAHTLWLQIGAELGLPGLGALLTFYLLSVARLWPLARGSAPVPDPWLQEAAAMVTAGLIGFMVSAQFVSLPGLELPYYATLLGAGVLKLSSLQPAAEDAPAEAVWANAEAWPEHAGTPVG